MTHKKTTKKDTSERRRLRRNIAMLRRLSTKTTDPTTTVPKKERRDPDSRGGRLVIDPTPEEYAAFASHVDQSEPGPCWAWKGQRNRNGYGRLTWRRRQHLAHRLSWALANGRWPGDLQVMHSCDNRACVNPAHLSLGTAKENSVDAAVKGRLRRKLTPEAVRDIRASHEAGQTVWQIGKRYPVSVATIRAVVDRRTWRHVDG